MATPPFALCVFLFGAVAAAAAPGAGRGKPNGLTAQEKKEGWRLLFDGTTTKGWRSAKGDKFPERGWHVKKGELAVVVSGGGESAQAGDIITTETFSSFILKVEFKLTAGANSGIKYFVDPELNKGAGSAIGLEFQVLDDGAHPDAKQGRDGNRTLASLYDLIPAAAAKKSRPIGQWNEAMIVSRGTHCEHWLNGEKVLEYERGSKEFRDLVAISKYKVWPGFGEKAAGHILLQEHGNPVSFRNIKIKAL